MIHERVLLIVGQTKDIHVERVSDLARSRGFLVHHIDREDQEGKVVIHLEQSVAHLYFDYKTNAQFKQEQVVCIWWRLKPTFQADYVGGTATAGEKFRVSEWKPVIRSLPFMFPSAVCINNVDNHYNASIKPRQLLLAQQCGLKIPKTVITNNADEVLDIFSPRTKLIYKTLNSFIVPPDEIVFTNLVSRNEIKSSKSQIALAPCIFQEYIEKKFELRVTVVNSSVFCAKIDSQRLDETSIDWRRNQSANIYTPFELPDEASNKLLRLHRTLGLDIAAYDLIVNKNDEYIFLECNPGGQWLWVEEHTKLPITDSVAQLLCR